MTSSFDESPTISPEFIQQIRNFLDHLYDFPYQQKQALVLLPADTGYPFFEIAGPKVRKLILEALEKIGEEKNLAFRSSQARFYNLLRLHYIEGMSVNDAANELGLSQRQTYRDLRSADEMIASLVWLQLIEQMSTPEVSQVIIPNSDDSKQPTQHLQPTNLSELISTVFNIVHPLAASHEVELLLTLPEQPVVVSTNAMVARQVITGLFSMAIQKALPHPLEISLAPNGRECVLRLSFQAILPAIGSLPEKFTDPSIGVYAQNLGWHITNHLKTGQKVEIEVSMQTYRRTCLIIDDHSEFVDLMERYMDSSNITIASADSGPKGIELARQLHPDIIILDIMIPEVDGWQVLQTLHAAQATKTIPIIVCSVFYDPDLALTLGAVDVLKKPVRKEDLVTALKKQNIL